MPYSVWQAFITDGGEAIVQGASVTVYNEASGALATLYDGPAGAATANPQTSAIDGLVRFYVPAGKYKIVVTKGALSKEFRHCPTGEAGSKDVGVANGVASLDEAGYVPTSQLPPTLVGALRYMGVWDASAGTAPSISPGQGEYWVVSVQGATSLSGITDWKVTDWAIYDGAAWQKVDNSQAPVAFLDLTDAPVSYAGHAGHLVAVTGTEDGLEFFDAGPALAAKQDLLVSGTNIKTVNGGSLLGAGNLVIGLQNFTEGRIATAPYTSVPLHTLTATGAETNISSAVCPKGSGSFQLRTGGQPRGLYAVDLQIDPAGSYVANGSYSVVAGGNDNAAQSDYCAVGGGRDNNASASYIAISGGRSNSASGSYCAVGGGYNNAVQSNWYGTIAGGYGNLTNGGQGFIGGGYGNTANGATSLVVVGGMTNTASAQEATVVGGINNLASGFRSFIGGGRNNTASGQYSGVLSGEYHTASANHSVVLGGMYGATRANPMSAVFGAYGSQTLFKQFNQTTSDATPTNLGDDATAPATYVLANSMQVAGTIQVVGSDGTDDYAAWIEFLGVRRASAGTTTLIGSAVVREIKSAGAAAWAAAVIADTTLGGFQVRVTGAAGKTIKWAASLMACERK